MLKMKKVTETYELRVFTDNGDYFGDIEDSIVRGNKVSGWKIKASKNSYLQSARKHQRSHCSASDGKSGWGHLLSFPRAPRPADVDENEE